MFAKSKFSELFKINKHKNLKSQIDRYDGYDRYEPL